jgi:hypothetical protein
MVMVMMMMTIGLKQDKEPGMMVHTCNPSYLGGGGKREQPRRKLKTL